MAISRYRYARRDLRAMKRNPRKRATSGARTVGWTGCPPAGGTFPANSRAGIGGVRAECDAMARADGRSLPGGGGRTGLAQPLFEPLAGD
jgi:hypothetical protein